MKIVADSAAAKTMDQQTVLTGVSLQTLIENAAAALKKHCPEKGSIAIVAGPGNNGADGFALALALAREGRAFDLHAFSVSTDAQYFADRLREEFGIEPTPAERGFKQTYDIIFDCIFGIGLKRDVIGRFANMIKAIDLSGAYVISADIASGLSADSGKVMGVAVHAQKTVSFATYKAGQFLQDGKDHSGEVAVEPVGIKVLQTDCSLIEKKDLRPLIAHRRHHSNKYDYGFLCIVGGSKRYVGAPMLAEMGRAALRTGVGLCRLVIPENIYTAVAANNLLATLFPMRARETMLYDAAQTDAAIQKADALAVGMGLGRSADTVKLVRHLLSAEIDLLLDADALWAYSQLTEAERVHRAQLVLTPHMGEFLALSGLKKEAVAADPISAAKQFAKQERVILLLKGPTTIVTDGSRVWLSDTGNPSMAKGGSGDLLSGIIGALLAAGVPAEQAAYGGAWLAGKAGEAAWRRYGVSALPTDTVECLPEVIGSIVDHC